ncbi:hypothetical protein GTA08_BOTSDO04457 [Neofusicoccum parvum]|uniref:Uncharacterized protein n=1 Tax=Neofusicoccum parvum TaxID=310453 RepID=A0ACB5RVI2_9PEZI|nr:hypothetical protein GTA08_BOTSDO04457 [Neofusicoccum parvum]
MPEETPPDRLRTSIKRFSGIIPRLQALQYLGDDAIYTINTVLAYSRLRSNNKRPWGYESLQALKSLLLEETGGEKEEEEDSNESDSAGLGSSSSLSPPSPGRQHAAPTREEAIDAGDALAHFIHWTRPLFIHWPLLDHTVETLQQAVAGSRDDWKSQKLSHRAWKSLLAPPTPGGTGLRSRPADPRRVASLKKTFWPPLDKRDADPGQRLLARLAERHALNAWNAGKAGRMLRVVADEGARADRAGGSRALLEGLDLREMVAGVLLLADRSAEDDRAAQRRKLARVEALTGVGRGRLVVADRQLNRFFAKEARRKGEVLVPGMGDWAKGVFYTKFERLDGVDESEGEETDADWTMDESDKGEEVIRVLRHKKPKVVAIEEASKEETSNPGPGSKAAKEAAKAKEKGGRPVADVKEKEEPSPTRHIFSRPSEAKESSGGAEKLWEVFTGHWTDRNSSGLKQIDEELNTGIREIFSLASAHEPFRGVPSTFLLSASAILARRLQNKPWSLTGFGATRYHRDVYASLYHHVAMQVRSGNVAFDFWFPFDDEFKMLPIHRDAVIKSKRRKVDRLTGVELAEGLFGWERELFASYNLLGNHRVFNDEGCDFPKTRSPELNRARVEMAEQLIEVSQNELKRENLTPAERHGLELDIGRLRYDIQVLLGVRKGELSSQADSGQEIKPTPPGFRTNRPTVGEVEELKRKFHGIDDSSKRVNPAARGVTTAGRGKCDEALKR